LAAGASVADLLAAGVSVADLLAAGANVADLVTAGASVADLLSAGVSISDLFNVGVGVGALEQNGVTSQQLTEAGLIGTVLDIDENTYKWVKIGTQVWMAENLKAINYKNGTAIEYPGTDNTAWANNTTGAYAWYNNNEATYKPTYGALYNWHSVNTGNLCPSNWHIPTDADWTMLIDYLGGENVAGAKLKEIGTTHWKSPNPGATNETGFTALPGGYRLPGGVFFDIRNYGYYWSATEATSISAFYRQSIADFSNINRGATNKEYGMLVRCIKD
jgi:uncharacterized protein (TIGR02145 family)